jgi:hypothetical protein
MSTTVGHVLAIYQTRMRMQQDGVTNPNQEIKELTRTIVEKLSTMNQEEKLTFENHMMKDSKGNIIAKFPEE